MGGESSYILQTMTNWKQSDKTKISDVSRIIIEMEFIFNHHVPY